MTSGDTALSLNDYQVQAKEFALYPGTYQVVYPALGLAGETGEAVELVKKWIRDDHGDTTFDLNPNRLEKLKLELGDVLWYLANLASDCGLSLESIAQSNLRKLKSRLERNQIHGSGDDR